jgi:hypothetical protein
LIRISICGDLVPTASNAAALFARGEIEAVLDEPLRSALMAADARA